MNEIVAALSRLIGQVIFWATVEPWEQAIRVRAGKFVRRLKPGFHLRIPILDVIHKQSVRMRSAPIPTQTLSTADGATLIAGATLGYAIADIDRLYRSLHHPEDTVTQIAAAALAKHIFSTKRDAITAEGVNEAVRVEIAVALEPFGLAEVSLRLTDFAFVRAYRLVQDQRGWAHGKALATERES